MRGEIVSVIEDVNNIEVEFKSNITTDWSEDNNGQKCLVYVCGDITFVCDEEYTDMVQTYLNDERDYIEGLLIEKILN